MLLALIFLLNPTWNCVGIAPLPKSGTYKHAVAYLKAEPGAHEKVTQQAKDKLAHKLCGNSKSCEALRSEFELFPNSVQQGNQQVCAQFIIDEAAYLRWQKQARSLTTFEQKLEKNVGTLLGKKTKAPVYITKITQKNIEGGVRALWLRGRMEEALVKAGVEVLSKPPKTQRHISIEGTITPRRDKRGVPILEIQWRSLNKDKVSGIAKVIIPEEAAPAEAPLGNAPQVTQSKQISLSFEHADGDASFCEGKQIDLWLNSKRDLHVMLFNLYDGQAHLILPFEGYSERINAGGRLKVGPLEAFPLGQGERFLLLAAPKRADLGWLAALPNGCKLTPQQSARLHRGDYPKGIEQAVLGYRFIQGPRCGDALTDAARAQKRQALQRALDDLPLCP
ncbi:hypothetical protein KKF91_05230 [Myxococcota bacterium]|nr:hypothetical protein [Myxococcota bacterium]